MNPFPLNEKVVCNTPEWEKPLGSGNAKLPQYGTVYHVRGYGETCQPPELYLVELQGELRPDGSEIGYDPAGFRRYTPVQEIPF